MYDIAWTVQERRELWNTRLSLVVYHQLNALLEDPAKHEDSIGLESALNSMFTSGGMGERIRWSTVRFTPD